MTGRGPIWAALLVGGVLVLCGCEDATPRVTPAFVTAAKAQDPQADPLQLARGRELYVVRCGACHDLPSPMSQAPGAWPKVLATMARRSHLTHADQRDILRYVLAVPAGRNAPQDG